MGGIGGENGRRGGRGNFVRDVKINRFHLKKKKERGSPVPLEYLITKKGEKCVI